MKHETLTKTLVAIGKPPYTVEMPGGGRVLLLPHGGRVLGLFGPGDEENYYWTNPALASPESADVYYSGDDWQNSGGDRAWLAPELDLFFRSIRISTSRHTTNRDNSIRAATRLRSAMEPSGW